MFSRAGFLGVSCFFLSFANLFRLKGHTRRIFVPDPREAIGHCASVLGSSQIFDGTYSASATGGVSSRFPFPIMSHVVSIVTLALLNVASVCCICLSMYGNCHINNWTAWSRYDTTGPNIVARFPAHNTGSVFYGEAGDTLTDVHANREGYYPVCAYIYCCTVSHCWEWME